MKVYYIGAFDAFIMRHPQADLDVYVDDVQSSTAGSEEAITTRLTEAIEDLGHMVEHQIESRFVPTKAAVVASSDRLARKLPAALGEFAGTPIDFTEALGIDFAAVAATAPVLSFGDTGIRSARSHYWVSDRPRRSGGRRPRTLFRKLWRIVLRP